MIEFAKTKWIAASRVNLAPYNPRKPIHPESTRGKQLRASLDAFGCVEPLVWNQRTGFLVAGHQRFSMLLAEGVTRVLVSMVDLDDDQERRLNLALNKIDGEWDEDLLAGVLRDLTSDATSPIDDIGFSSAEIDRLLDGITDGSGAAASADEDAIKAADDSAPITRFGELIELGPHRLLCGDATEPGVIEQLFGDRRAQLLHTDPPYNVAYNAADRPTGSASKSRPIANDKMTDAEYREFTARWLRLAKDRLIPGGGFYIWNGFANFGMLSDVLSGLKLRPRHVITWAKESFSPGFGDFNEQTEFCMYGRKAGGRRRWHGGKNESTLWSIPRDRTLLYRHPTQKPLPLAERAIRNSSKRGELVFDPFLGSGTTLVAAARLGRRCFGTEIDPRYCDVVVARYIAAAGRNAVTPEVIERWGGLIGKEMSDVDAA
ncbi:MAG: DNA modification methylase [Planctomycetota bacterium]